MADAVLYLSYRSGRFDMKTLSMQLVDVSISQPCRVWVLRPEDDWHFVR